MANLTRDFFIALSNNKFLNKAAKKYGYNLGAEQFVGGTDVDSVMESVKELNALGISCTVDNLGEFVSEKHESTAAKEKILDLIERIHEEGVDCHISIKLTQLGLDIDEAFCLENTKEIVDLANKYNIFINIDMEDYLHLEPTYRVLNELYKTYQNVGTVIQSYLFRAEADIEQHADMQLRIVKGAYKESESVAYQDKNMIDEKFLELTKKRLKGDAFTSIATHDHHLINAIKRFVHEEDISKDKFEFQMLYGFRIDMQQSLAKEGYNFTTYIPFGDDWYGYFMRRLAERPQNMGLVIKDKLYDDNNQIKKTPLLIAGASALLAGILFWRKRK